MRTPFQKFIKAITPSSFRVFIRKQLKTALFGIVKICRRLGYEIYPIKSYYSPIPNFEKLKSNLSRWTKPSKLVGVPYKMTSMESLLIEIIQQFKNEYALLPTYSEMVKKKFGPGYTYLDSLVLYCIIRKFKPKRYVEVGSGLSTWYCAQAAIQNLTEGHSLKISCIEPFPHEKLKTIPNIEITQLEVQEVAVEYFDKLESGDILFIDSSHIVKVDSDVPFLHLEVLPRLKKGVIVHIHDIPFPYNTPFPPDRWVLKPGFPMYWNEAMLVQAFLAFNDSFEILLSAPLIRFHNEKFLEDIVPHYEGIQKNPNTFSSLWIKKIKD
ncbi:MAG TPA: hypothetical protein DIS66_06335 [Candidatus Omnitrophica bacterium]|nr:hypothetical protein [Candidatus Omnitrophota bacterium]